ncbi:MAG TPA: hypothetical protein VJY64_01640 [Candidatus Onthovivens sp.]|nr:hypothetical protein [Candidatus Onthovivens sp.]
MRKLILTILDTENDPSPLLKELSQSGFNASVVGATSLRRIFEEGDDIPVFFSLQHLTNRKYRESTIILLVVEDSEIDKVREIVNKTTDHFNTIKGAIMVINLEQFIGSF